MKCSSCGKEMGDSAYDKCVDCRTLDPVGEPQKAGLFSGGKGKLGLILLIIAIVYFVNPMDIPGLIDDAFVSGGLSLTSIILLILNGLANKNGGGNT